MKLSHPELQSVLALSAPWSFCSAGHGLGTSGRADGSSCSLPSPVPAVGRSYQRVWPRSQRVLSLLGVPTEPAGGAESCCLHRSLLMFTMENCFYLLISQAVRYLRDPGVHPRDKQRMKQELSSELVREPLPATASLPACPGQAWCWVKGLWPQLPS